jgi:indolepyruvate ferredoxin oxidoreductase
MERELIEWYQKAVQRALSDLTSNDAAQALAIAAIPEQIRGFGHVKTASVEKAHARLAQLQQPLTTRDLFPAPHAA